MRYKTTKIERIRRVHNRFYKENPRRYLCFWSLFLYFLGYAIPKDLGKVTYLLSGALSVIIFAFVTEVQGLTTRGIPTAKIVMSIEYSAIVIASLACIYGHTAVNNPGMEALWFDNYDKYLVTLNAIELIIITHGGPWGDIRVLLSHSISRIRYIFSPAYKPGVAHNYAID